MSAVETLPDEAAEPQKSAKQLEKEAKKAAKLQKLQQKMDKKTSAPAPAKEKPERKLKETKEVAVYEGDTLPGEKKDLSGSFPDAYSPRYVEAAWYSWWEKEGFFKPEYNRKSLQEVNPKGVFSIVIPPPNVTGSLHLGHALTNAIEDAITRWHRMKGRTTLWVPGCDHAGIATQVVVEKKMWREQGQTRHDVGREAFIERIWEWRNEKGDRIYDQLRRLGSSPDWSRVAFTMDPKLCKAVVEAFVRLYDRGYVYRSSRLVNWSCTLRSAISDIEVDKIELPGRTFLPIPGYEKPVEFGVLVSFAYKVDGTEEEVIVATTRIETMLGDTAVAIHPADPRYLHLHGKFVKHPFTDRKLPIVCDDFVDVNFGTGAVKITPAHDPNDYEVGKRHNLTFLTIFNDDGIIIGDCGEFTGMKRFECRVKILGKLKDLGLYRNTENHPMVVPMCSRSKDIVEPMIKPQWYVKCDEMAERAKQAVTSGELKIIPESHTKTWFHWMDGIRDWCISRQLWWGHRIPAYRVNFLKRPANLPEEEIWIVGRSLEEAKQRVQEKYSTTPENFTLHQDEDVLDTWFSSGLFPFSVFGWPDTTIDLDTFYPTSLLETGHDILFFWVARMVFFGHTLLGKLPFREVFLHPIVRDAHGRKMSKSLGNVIDPMDVITGITLEDLHKQLLDSNLDPKEIDKAIAGQKRDYPNGIPECGTDAMRFALCSYMTQGRDINLDILRVQGYRFFCNKLWNAARFALTYLNEDVFAPIGQLSGEESNMDLWILSRLAATIDSCNNSFESYEFAAATNSCYNFWLYELCDIYLECVKPVFAAGGEKAVSSAQRTLYTCLEYGLKLISPFMPFISEELFQRLPRADKTVPSICVAPYPELKEAQWRSEGVEREFELVNRTAKIVRSARSDYNLPNKTKTAVFVVGAEEATLEVLKKYSDDLCTLAYCEKVVFGEDPPVGCAILTITAQCEVHLLLKGLIEVEKEIGKLERKHDQLTATVGKLSQLISSVDYESKVPEEVRSSNADKLTQSEIEIKRIVAAIETLKLM